MVTSLLSGQTQTDRKYSCWKCINTLFMDIWCVKGLILWRGERLSWLPSILQTKSFAKKPELLTAKAPNVCDNIHQVKTLLNPSNKIEINCRSDARYQLAVYNCSLFCLLIHQKVIDRYLTRYMRPHIQHVASRILMVELQNWCVISLGR